MSQRPPPGVATPTSSRTGQTRPRRCARRSRAARPSTRSSTATSPSCCRSCGSPSPACRSCSAFLLSLAFTQRFEELDGFDLSIYTVALLSTALATMVLIAPVSFHRIVFRRRQKAALVVVADRLLIVGLALLVPAICSAVLLILDVVLGRWPASSAAPSPPWSGC